MYVIPETFQQFFRNLVGALPLPVFVQDIFRVVTGYKYGAVVNKGERVDSSQKGSFKFHGRWFDLQYKTQHKLREFFFEILGKTP